MSLFRLVPVEERRREDVLLRCRRCGTFARGVPTVEAPAFVFELDHECPRPPFDIDRWVDEHAVQIIFAAGAIAALVLYAMARPG